MSSDSGDSFPERLFAARKLRGLSQAELAKRAGIQSSTVAHFEGGDRKPSFDNFVKLVEALEVPADYLIGRSSRKTMSTEIDPVSKAFARLQTHDRELATKILNVLLKHRR